MKLVYVYYTLLFVGKVNCSGHNHHALQVILLNMTAAKRLS